jgi:hypothetical protein
MADPIRAALERLQEYATAHPEHDTDRLLAAALAALAAEPPAPANSPTLAEIDAAWLASYSEAEYRYDVVAFTRTILSRWGNQPSPPAPPTEVPSDEDLWEVQLKARRHAQPDAGWKGVKWTDWTPNDTYHPGHMAAHRALHDYGYQQGLADGRAEQGSLGRSFNLLPEILDTLRRAIREPAPCPHIRSNGESNWCALAEQQAAPEPDAEPEPNQALAGDHFPAATKMVPAGDGEREELVDRLGWIAAQLSDIGWEGDSASVARAAALLRQPATKGLVVKEYVHLDSGARIKQSGGCWVVRNSRHVSPFTVFFTVAAALAALQPPQGGEAQR